ncbi:MAG: hypothetical protein ABID87_03430 [Chloroflexota bacterium]
MVKITKAIARQRLEEVPPEKRFWFSDGKAIKSLPEMASMMPGLSGETFRHHVNSSNNDFSNWVRDVIGDDKLARDLLKCTAPAQAARAIAARIDWLQQKTVSG